MSESAPVILGTASQIYALFGDSIEVDSVYGKRGSQLYHTLTLRENAEIGEMLEAAGEPSGTVLELACGSGRLTFPFLEAGHTVLGLDFSPHMLAHLARRLAEPEAAAHADRLTTIEGDMTDFTLDQRFDLILLAASAVLNVTPELRAKMFRCVHEHLTETGRFLVTILDFPALEDPDATAFENTAVFPAHDGISPILCTFLDYIDPAERIRSTNFVSHTVQDGAVTETVIYTTLTYPLTLSELDEELKAVGLRVVAQHDVTSGYQVLKAGKYPVRGLLLEISR